MILTRDNIDKMAEELGYKLEDVIDMKANDYIMLNKKTKLKKLENGCWITLDTPKLIPWKIERDNKRRKVWRQFINCRNYALKYGEERVEAVAKGIDEESMVEIVSDNLFISQQVKNTNNSLSEEDGFTKTLDKIADYILFTKFDNKDQEEKHEEAKQELKELEASKKTENIKNKIESLKEVRRNTPYSKTKKLSKLPKHYMIHSLEQQEDVGNNGLIAVSQPVNYTRVDRQMENGKFHESMEEFWERYSPNKPNDIPFYTKNPINYKEFAHETMLQYIAEIQHLEDKPYSPERAKIISNLKGEMRTALGVLRKIISFNPTPSIEETIPSDSWEYLSLRNIDTYRVLLLNYQDLNERYKTKVNTNMWALLRSFEQIVENTDLQFKESVILDLIMNQGITQLEELQCKLENEYQIQYSKSNLSKIVNNKIPNSILQAHEKELEDWIWINRRKGLYKKCSKCGKIKLAVDTRYFKPDKKGKFGLRGTCRACEIN